MMDVAAATAAAAAIAAVDSNVGVEKWKKKQKQHNSCLIL